MTKRDHIRQAWFNIRGLLSYLALVVTGAVLILIYNERRLQQVAALDAVEVTR